MIVFALCVTAEVAPEASVCDVNGEKCGASHVSLMQKGVNRHTFAKAHVGDEPKIHDHMHIVCHAEGCAEVKASLAVLEERITMVKQKLEECGTSRAKLEKDLAVAAKDRATAEKGLAKCAAERAKLSADLAQCGKDRAAAEKALAKCGHERAILEAELRQCAEVDRPAAEKGLAKCGQERQALEIELAKLVEKLKSGAGATTKKSSRRRRRRNKKSSSLAQTSADEEDQADAHEEMEDQKEAVEARLVQLKAEAEEFEQKLQKLADTESATLAAIGASDDKIADAESNLANVAAREQQAEQDSAAAEEKTTTTIAETTVIGSRLTKIVTAVEHQIEEIGAASTQLATETGAKTNALVQLMGLVQKQATLKHQELSLMHNNHAEKLRKVEEALKDHDHEECDDVRAQIITAKGKVKATAAALQTCLNTKKIISAKIAKIEKARAIAQQKLDACLATKAKLKAALHECHTRRDSAREKLQECLDRKKVLKTKIHECHLRRDEARKKLAACLEAKKSLKAKIQAVKDKMGSLSSASLIEIMDEHAKEHSLVNDVDAIEEELDASNKEFASTSLELIKEGEAEDAALSEYQEASAEADSTASEMASAEKEEAATEETQAELEAELEDTLQELEQIDADSNTAVAACKASEDAVNGASSALLAFQARISKQ